jgi:hypothetical protein
MKLMKAVKKLSAPLIGCILVLALAGVALAQATIQTTLLVTVPQTNDVLYGDGDSYYPSISASGKMVAFQSQASNLESSETGHIANVFARVNTTDDWQSSQAVTLRLSRLKADLTGCPAAAYSSFPAASRDSSSHDGEYVIFQSAEECLDLSGSGTSDAPATLETDIFLAKINAGTPPTAGVITRISLPDASDGSGVEPNGHSGNVRVQPDGSALRSPFFHPMADIYFIGDSPKVAFESLASNLVSGDGNGKKDIFLRSPNINTTTRLSLTPSGAELNGDSFNPVFSKDPSQPGRFMAFVSTATNLLAGDTDTQPDVYLMDRDADNNGSYDEFGVSEAVKVYLVSKKLGTSQSGGAPSGMPSLSAINGWDGTNQIVLAFQSQAALIPALDTDANDDIYLYRVSIDASGTAGSSTLELASVNSAGEKGNLPSAEPSISLAGQLLTFKSYATNLVEGDSNHYCPFSPGNYTIQAVDNVSDYNCEDVFVRTLNLADNQTWRASLTQDGREGRYLAVYPVISGDGRYVAFQSVANLDGSGTGSTNNQYQIFLRDQGTPPGNPIAVPSSHDFGQVGPLNLPAPRSVSLIFLDTLTIHNIGFAPGSSAAFSLTENLCTPGATYGQGDSCTLKVAFSPANTMGNDFSAQLLVDVSPGPGQTSQIRIGFWGSTARNYLPYIRK